MFKKKPTIKTLSPLRSSDRRKLADRIIADFGLKPILPSQADGGESKSAGKASAQSSTDTRHTANSNGDSKPLDKDKQTNHPEPAGESAEAEATKAAEEAATTALTALRALILPTNSLTARFSTTTGPNLQLRTGTVYIGAHSTDQRILWLELEGRMYPSIYSLWRIPGLLPLLHTPSTVIQKMRGGADLMVPGLAGPPFPRGAKDGAIVAVAAYERKSVPLAVGVCRIDVSGLESTRGGKGVAVETFLVEGDEVWGWGVAGREGEEAPERLEGWWDEDGSKSGVDGVDGVAAGIGELEVEDDEVGGVSLKLAAEAAEKLEHESTRKTPSRNEHVEGEDVDAGPGAAGEEMTTKEIDAVFRSAFLYGIHTHIITHPAPHHGLTFPITQTQLLSRLVLPFLPPPSTPTSTPLAIKRTSWKTTRRFIKALEKERLVLAKDRPGNEADVTAVNFESEAFKTFVPYKLPKAKKETNSDPKASDNNADSNGPASASTLTSTADASIGQTLQRLDLYRPTAILTPLFPANTLQKYHTRAELLSLLTSYISTHSLASAKNARNITLDPFLGSLLSPATIPTDAELLARGTCPRDILAEKILTHTTRHHAILHSTETLSTLPKNRIKPNAPPQIEIKAETRGGNKTVTRISGLAAYFVPAQPFADELKRICAGSSGVEMSKSGRGEEGSGEGVG